MQCSGGVGRKGKNRNASYACSHAHCFISEQACLGLGLTAQSMESGHVSNLDHKGVTVNCAGLHTLTHLKNALNQRLDFNSSKPSRRGAPVLGLMQWEQLFSGGTELPELVFSKVMGLICEQIPSEKCHRWKESELISDQPKNLALKIKRHILKPTVLLSLE